MTARDVDGIVRRPRVTISGSFHRHLSSIQSDVARFIDAGLEVLSPSDPQLVDTFGDFLFVASDRVRTLRLVQQRHFEAIRESDFLWLVCPDGYVGLSAAMEIGVAVDSRVPVVALTPPHDQTVRQYVRVVGSWPGALAGGLAGGDRSGPTTLVDPVAGAEAAHKHLDEVVVWLTRGDGAHRLDDPRVSSAAAAIRHSIKGL